jgi:hypothetical protein
LSLGCYIFIFRILFINSMKYFMTVKTRNRRSCLTILYKAGERISKHKIDRAFIHFRRTNNENQCKRLVWMVWLVWMWFFTQISWFFNEWELILWLFMTDFSILWHFLNFMTSGRPVDYIFYDLGLNRQKTSCNIVNRKSSCGYATHFFIKDIDKDFQIFRFRILFH